MWIPVLFIAVGLFLAALAVLGLIRPQKKSKKDKSGPMGAGVSVRWLIYGVVLILLGSIGAWKLSVEPVVTNESQFEWAGEVKDNCDEYKTSDAGSPKNDISKRNRELLRAVQLNGINGIFNGIAMKKGGAQVEIDIGKVKLLTRPLDPNGELYAKATGHKKGDCVKISGSTLEESTGTAEGMACDQVYLFSLAGLMKCN